MVFTDLFFLYIFLPVQLLLYFTTNNRSVRNSVLILFSLFFYAWGEPVWVSLLLLSAFVDYIHGRVIDACPNTTLAKGMVVSSLLLNLGLLSIFKYGNLILSGVNFATGLSFPETGFSLPIGISFYTFQTISYTVDVYRGEVKAQKSFWKFLLFVSLFHQLVAGPIVRYKDIAEDIENRVTTTAEVFRGIKRFIVGVGKKVLLANIAGALAGTFLSSQPEALSVAGAWAGAALYGLQIFFDFAGYSDMAIGLGLMMGFHYGENFNYPYIAKSVGEFWRRWHISLGSFFRDYLYIPLGGNRHHYYRNLLITWFATGLWHGASVNFILWGLYFGFFIALERLFLNKWVLKPLPNLFGHLYLLVVAIVGWVIFYFEDFFVGGIAYLKVMFGMSGNPLMDVSVPILLTNNIYWLILALTLCTPIVPWIEEKYIAELSQGKLAIVDTLAPLIYFGIFLLSTALLVGDSYNPFLYFRF